MKHTPPDKTAFLDSSGNPLTQSLFLEIGYNDAAIYTLKEYDHTYKGKVYPSLRRIFIEEEDVVEYHFATKWLLSWNHWQRLNRNKALASHFKEWREELSLKLQSDAVQEIINKTASEGSVGLSAANWLAEKGWDKKGAGRPKKDTEAQTDAIAEKIKEEFEGDLVRMSDYRK